jgi:predicted helicase
VSLLYCLRYQGLSDRLTANHKELYGQKFNLSNKVIAFTAPSSQKPFMSLISEHILDWHFVGAACGTVCFPLHIFDENENKTTNITNWVLNQFLKKYGKKEMSKEAIFYYVYAVLHNPIYRIKYEINLKGSSHAFLFITISNNEVLWVYN